MLEVNTVTDYNAYTANGKKDGGYGKYETGFDEIIKGTRVSGEKEDGAISGGKAETNEEGVSFSGVDMEFYNYSGEKFVSSKLSGRMVDIAI